MPKKKPKTKDIVSEDIINQEDFEGETKEQIEDDMKENKRDEDVYSEEGRNLLEEDDEITAGEEGFMQGAEGRGGKYNVVEKKKKKK